MKIKNLLAKAAENWPAKAVCIAMAVVLFIFHRMSTVQEHFFLVPLTIEAEDNLIPSKSYHRIIRINLRGNTDTIYSILEDDIEAFVDLEKFQTPGDYRVEVQIRKKGTALGLDTLQIRPDPAEIDLSLDYKVSKFVPLVVSLRGAVEPGFVLNSHSLNPAQILIEGPSVSISAISELYTELIDISGRNNNFTIMTNIIIPDPLIVTRSSGAVEFRGFISRNIPERSIPGVMQ